MSQPAYLLSLETLHAAAPGVLDVVFGPDGDFEGAPFWAGPVTEIGRYCNHGACRWVATVGRQVHTIEITPPLDLDDVALDLRIPTVAGRLAGLCARALRPRIGGATPWNIEESDGGVWILCPARRHGLMWFWESNGMGRADAPTVRLPDDCDREGFLRALTLILAPRIAALRTTASPR